MSNDARVPGPGDMSGQSEMNGQPRTNSYNARSSASGTNRQGAMGGGDYPLFRHHL